MTARLDRLGGSTAVVPWLLACAAAVALAGCTAGRAGGPPETAIRGFHAESRVIGRAPAYVEVSVYHRSRDHRLERIALVTPGGREIAAESFRRDVLRTRRVGRPSGAIGIGTFGVGIAVGLPILLGRPPTTWRYRATFRVPAPRAYRRAYAGWRIAIRMTERKTGPITIVRPAPAPDI